jgi:hypothetical protein
MQKLVLTLATAAVLLFAGSSAWQAQAQTQVPAASNIIGAAATLRPTTKVACQGPGRYCGPGFVRACGPAGCVCRPCR